MSKDAEQRALAAYIVHNVLDCDRAMTQKEVYAALLVRDHLPIGIEHFETVGNVLRDATWPGHPAVPLFVYAGYGSKYRMSKSPVPPKPQTPVRKTGIERVAGDVFAEEPLTVAPPERSSPMPAMLTLGVFSVSDCNALKEAIQERVKTARPAEIEALTVLHNQVSNALGAHDRVRRYEKQIRSAIKDIAPEMSMTQRESGLHMTQHAANYAEALMELSCAKDAIGKLIDLIHIYAKGA